MYHLSKE
jgi:hypothetical protein